MKNKRINNEFKFFGVTGLTRDGERIIDVYAGEDAYYDRREEPIALVAVYSSANFPVNRKLEDALLERLNTALRDG